MVDGPYNPANQIQPYVSLLFLSFSRKFKNSFSSRYKYMYVCVCMLCVCVCVCLCMCVCYYRCIHTHTHTYTHTHKDLHAFIWPLRHNQSTISLNSEFSFSWAGFHTKNKKASIPYYLLIAG